jgi:cysteine-rich repeat protein
MSGQWSATSIGLGLLAIALAAQPAQAVQSKCLAKKTKCVASKLSGLLACHGRAETPGKPPDPNAKECVDKARAKFDGGAEPSKGCFEKEEGKANNDCVTFDDMAALEAIVDSCVGAFVEAVDPAPIDQSKCGAGKKKCIASKVSGLLKCHEKAQKPGKPEDPNTKGCIDKVRAKFDGGEDPAKGCFAKLENKSRNDCLPPLGNSAAIEELVDACVTTAIAALEGSEVTTTTTSSTPPTTTTTSTAPPTTTSTTTTTTSTAPPTTTTSTTLPQTTTTTTTTSTTTTTPPTAVCGNGVLEAPETCDDGNVDPNDSCPEDCRIDQCEPTGDPLSLTIVSSRPDLTNILLLLDYPEGRMEIPGLGFEVIGSISNTPGENTDALDLGVGSAEHALRLLVSASFSFDTPNIATVAFRGCAGAPPPGPGDFNCIVLEAGADFMHVQGVTCSVTIP